MLEFAIDSIDSIMVAFPYNTKATIAEMLIKKFKVSWSKAYKIASEALIDKTEVLRQERIARWEQIEVS